MHFLAQDHNPTGTPQVSGTYVLKIEPGLDDCPEPHVDIEEKI